MIEPDMELLYSMRRKPLKCEPPRFDCASDTETVRPLCTISNANIIAFSSPTELDDVDGDTWGGHVYVCDLDTPWDSHKVASTSHPVSALEWDLEGKQLLIATSVGDVSVHGQKDYLLNEWQCLYTASFPGEHIIQAAFFHNGRRIVVTDKKPDAPITERIQALRSTPTLKGFGGLPMEGACVITATGLIGAVLAAADGSAAAAADCLRATRDHVTAASIAYKTGSLLVAALCAGCVRVYACGASAAPPAPPLAAVPLPVVYLLDNDVPTTISWCQKEEPDSLLIAGATLTLWKYSERAQPVHKLLSKGSLSGGATPGGGPKPPTETFNTVVWQKVCSWSSVVSMGGGAGAGVSAGAGAGAGASGVRSVCVLAPPGHALLATSTQLLLFARDTLHLVSSQSVVSSGSGSGGAGSGAGGGQSQDAPAAASPPKKTKYGPGASPSQCAAPAVLVCAAGASALGGALACVDARAQLHLYTITRDHDDIPVSLAVQQAHAQLEYALVSGIDCLDVLLTLKPALIEPLYERLTESFQRQPAAFQQFYYHSWLKLRIAVCRMSGSLQASVSSLTSLQMCGAVLSACAAAHRPDLALPLLDDDTDKSVATLEGKPELVSEAAPLSALRLGLQRALDVCLTALAQHPRPAHHTHGYEIWTECNALSVLRRLVVSWRACASAGARGADTLSRLLARLAAAAAQPPNQLTKQELIDECTTLAAQSNSPRVWESLPRCCVSAPHGRPSPLYFEYGVEPEALRYNPEPPPYAQCETTPSLAMDSIRYMYLGGGWRPARWRACGRCGARALPASTTARHPLQKAYDARFIFNCRCGGRWTLCSNI